MPKFPKLGTIGLEGKDKLRDDHQISMQITQTLKTSSTFSLFKQAYGGKNTHLPTMPKMTRGSAQSGGLKTRPYDWKTTRPSFRYSTSTLPSSWLNHARNSSSQIGHTYIEAAPTAKHETYDSAAGTRDFVPRLSLTSPGSCKSRLGSKYYCYVKSLSG